MHTLRTNVEQSECSNFQYLSYRDVATLQDQCCNSSKSDEKMFGGGGGGLRLRSKDQRAHRRRHSSKEQQSRYYITACASITVKRTVKM